jgi:hypothetical protein
MTPSRKPASRRTPPAPPDTSAAWTALVRGFADDPDVALPSGSRGKFGATALKVDGKIFAMLVQGALVVKLPGADIEAAIAAHQGQRLAMRGRVMKEWLVVSEAPRRWLALARRARAFVSGGAPRPARRSVPPAKAAAPAPASLRSRRRPSPARRKGAR